MGDDPVLRYACAAGCTMYFEDDLSSAQMERAMQDIVDYTISMLDE